MSSQETLSQNIELDASTVASTNERHDLLLSGPTESQTTFSAVPDGGYGWIVVLGASVSTFWVNAILGCWGIVQAALLSSELKDESPSTVSFIGSLTLATSPAFGLLATRLYSTAGSRFTAMIGMFIMGLGYILGSFTTNLPVMFITLGFLSGLGMSMVYATTNALPVQYFSGKLGLANGCIKLGGGIGGAVMALALAAMLNKVGVFWTLRIQGLMTIFSGLVAAYFMKDRTAPRKMPFVDFGMFNNPAFTALFLSAFIGTFALFVPPYYLPLFADTIHLSPSAGAILVAAFNITNAVGRFLSGPLSDWIGPGNTYVLLSILNAGSMLMIWPVSDTFGPLIVFAVINGVANGAFFTVFPTVVSSIFGPGRAATAMSMSITGFAPGYLLGAPITGYLVQTATGTGLAAYRPAIFYAGGVAACSALLGILARFILSSKVLTRV